MKLKYYLRGIGIGIIVAVVIMVIAFRIHGSEMSDEQVIERAQELGMVMPENGAVADLLEKRQEEEAQNDADDGNAANDGENADAENNADADKNSNVNNDTDTGQNTDDSKAGQKKSSADKTDNKDTADSSQGTTQGTAGQAGQYVTFVVSGGEYSDKISQNLQAAGLIEDAESYNKWLQETDYDNFIQPGTFQIPVGSTWDEIAVILTTKEEDKGQPAQPQGTQPAQPQGTQPVQP